MGEKKTHTHKESKAQFIYLLIHIEAIEMERSIIHQNPKRKQTHKYEQRADFLRTYTHINNRNGKGYIIHQNPIRKKKKKQL